MIPLLGNWYANTAHVFLFSYAFKFSKLGGMNQGVVPIVTTMAVIYNSITFYLVFGEKLSPSKIVGIIFTFACVGFLALNTNKVEEDGLETDGKYVMWSLGLAMLVPMGFSLKHFLIRKYKGSYDYKMLPIDSGILETLSCSVFTIYYYREN